MDPKDPGHTNMEAVEGEGKKKKRRTLFLFGGGKKDSSKDEALETSPQRQRDATVGPKGSVSPSRPISSTSIPVGTVSKGPRRVNTSRASLVWKSFEDGDFESELASELESRWQSGQNEGSMMHQTVKSACKRIWGRPFTNLCLHSDLPRLSHNLEIVDERSGQMLFKDEGQYKSGVDRVRELLMVLSRELDGPEVSRTMIDSLDMFQNSDLDANRQLETWLNASVGKFEATQPHWLNVLRCVNQGIVFPAVFHMKKLFTDKFAYKDSKGSWKVRISILNRDTIEVQHRKGEKSQLTGAQDNFSFSWSITFRLDLACSDLDVSVSIVDYIFDKEMDKSIRDELLTAMQPFLSGSAPYLAIWRKPLRKLPVARDFGRMCGRLSVFNYLGRAIHTRTPDLSGVPLIRKVLITLADCFNPELIPSLEESMDLRFRDEGETMEQLTKVLHEDKVVPDDSHLSSVLKCINTTVVFPAVDFLHARVYDKIRYKDVRGTWSTHITLGPAIRGSSNSVLPGNSSAPVSGSLSSVEFASLPSSSSPLSAEGEDAGEIPRYRYVSILHRKVEQAYSTEPKDQFQFEWILEFILNREMTIKDVHMGVVDFSFGPSTSEETKSLVLSTLKPYLRPTTFQTQASAVYSHELIDIAIKKVEELELLSKTLMSAYHPNMPHSTDVKTLLQALKTSIFNSEVRLPAGDKVKLHSESRSSPGSSRLSLPTPLTHGIHLNGISESPPLAHSPEALHHLNLKDIRTGSTSNIKSPRDKKHQSERPKQQQSPRELSKSTPAKSPRSRKKDHEKVTSAPLPPILDETVFDISPPPSPFLPPPTD